MISLNAIPSLKKRFVCILFGCLAVLFFLAMSPLKADHLSEDLDRRVNIGLTLFPNIISIDLDLARKLDSSGSLLLFVVYDHDQEYGEELRLRLEDQLATIHNKKVTVVALSAQQAAESNAAQPCGIFLAENFSGQGLLPIIAYAAKKQCILFSPYPKAMDRGVMVGLQVTSRIQPIVNLAGLQKAMVRLHKLFLQSAVRHE